MIKNYLRIQVVPRNFSALKLFYRLRGVFSLLYAEIGILRKGMFKK